MKQELKDYLNIGLIVIMLVGFWSFMIRDVNEKDMQNKLEKQTTEHLIDSLRGELFIKESELGRYELTLEHLKEVNPEAATQFENYLTNQTE